MEQVLGEIEYVGVWKCPKCKNINREYEPEKDIHYPIKCDKCGVESDVGFD